MLINSQNIRALGTAFNAAFQAGWAGVEPRYGAVAMTVNSTTGSEEYGWLGQMPEIREWLGDRQIANLSAFEYAIKNRSFESTVGVPRPAIEDDNVGVYTPIMTEFGRSARAFPDTLVFGLLKNGWTAKGYDGLPFFATNHKTRDEYGKPATWANTDNGGGNPWFLIDDTRAVKPVVFQQRKPFQFVGKTNVSDDNVFFNDQFIWGIDGRCNVGFGLPQLCWGSKQPLDADHYATARTAMMGFKGDRGQLLGVRPTLLVCGPSNERAALKLLNNALAPGGETNEWQGTAKLQVVEWLQ